jgi:4-hydroxybenzoate polyprenyltransferase
MSAAFAQLRTLLILGRVSNLPTVWSNCLAAWLLNGGQLWNNFYVLCVGATFLYVGGMFLNDAFDASFDRQFRKERPIPSGQITERVVWLIGATLLLLGWLLLSLLGLYVALVALLLVGVIFFYDAVHKRTILAPLIMAACRLLLYLVAASATLHAVNDAVVWHGLALAAYITGLSYLARGESGQGIASRWPLLLLLAPLVASVIINSHRDMVSWIASMILLAWMLWCLRGMVGRVAQPIGKNVAGLLAGIVLVDWAAVPRMADEFNLVFIGLFVLALVLQRKIPAT